MGHSRIGWIPVPIPPWPEGRWTRRFPYQGCQGQGRISPLTQYEIFSTSVMSGGVGIEANCVCCVDPALVFERLQRAENQERNQIGTSEC